MTAWDELRTAIGPGGELEAALGTPAIIRRPTSGARDPDTGKVASHAEQLIPCNVVRRTVELTTKEGGKIEATAFDIWTEPLSGDVIEFAGKTYRVSSVNEDAPDGLPISWVAIVGSGS